MGKRKRRLHHGKNYERKKYGLQVRIPFKMLKRPDRLLVSLPIASFSSVPVQELNVLHSRLTLTVPPAWSLGEITSSLLVLYKMQLLSSNVPSVTFSLCITDEYQWKLVLGGKEINKEYCEILNKHPCTLRCVDDVLLVLKDIDTSQLCGGNSDDRFSELVDARKGKFVDVDGKEFMVYNYFY